MYEIENEEILKRLRKKYYNFSNDKAFKYAFTNKRFLSMFLSIMWNKKIKPKDIEIIDSHVKAQDVDNKQIAFDVNGVVQDGSVRVFLDLEMQKRKPKEYNMNDRISYYYSRDKALSVSVGENYSSSRVECILFTDYEPDNDGWMNEIRFVNTYDNSYFTPDRIIVIQLQNLNNCNIIELKEFLLGFKVSKRLSSNKTLFGKEVEKMLDDINKSVWIKEQIVRAEYEAALKKKYDKERELEIKKLKEEKLKAEEEKLMAEKEKIQMVKNLYDKKIPLEFISEVSNLSIDEVKKIIG